MSYNVNEHGTITDPGKFEGEPLWVSFAYDASLNGDGDQYGDVSELGEHICYLVVDDKDRKEWGLDANVYGVSIMETDMGFVYGDTYNSHKEYNEAMSHTEDVIDDYYNDLDW